MLEKHRSQPKVDEEISQNETAEEVEAPSKRESSLNLFVVNEYLLEYISFFDFVTDLVITAQLMNTNNTLWAAITFCAMAAPHLVTSFQMINFLHNKVINRDKSASNLTLMVVSWLSISPLFILFMILMDTFMIFNSTLIVPIAYALQKCNVTCLTYGIE